MLTVKIDMNCICISKLFDGALNIIILHKIFGYCQSVFPETVQKNFLIYYIITSIALIIISSLNMVNLVLAD